MMSCSARRDRRRRSVGAVAAVVALAAPAARGQIPNPVLQALPDGQWSRLEGAAAMTSAGAMAIPCCDWGHGCGLSGIFSYSGATLDRQRHQILLWGGGHNDYFGNQLLAFDLATLSWRLETPPTSLCLFADPPDYAFTNGDPVARHTYDHVDVIDHLGVFFAFSGATSDRPLYNDGDSYGDLWTYDLATGTWTDHTALYGGEFEFWRMAGPGASGEYDPVTRLWFQNTSNGIWTYDFATREWDDLDVEGHPGIERVTVLDPVRRLLWSYGGDYGGDANLSAYDIDANTFTIVSATNLPGPRSGAGLAYDVANDQLVVFGGAPNGSVFNYAIATSTWTEYPSVGGPIAERTYGRFLYDETHNLFFLIHDVDGVWVWKNTLGNEPSIFRDGFESGDATAWSAGSP